MYVGIIISLLMFSLLGTLTLLLAFHMDHTQGDWTIPTTRALCGLVGANDCKPLVLATFAMVSTH
jgi:hypothetical protein